MPRCGRRAVHVARPKARPLSDAARPSAPCCCARSRGRRHACTSVSSAPGSGFFFSIFIFFIIFFFFFFFFFFFLFLYVYVFFLVFVCALILRRAARPGTGTPRGGVAAAADRCPA